MLYRKFGKTNEMVSALGFGCMRLPTIDNDYSKIDEEKALHLIRYAIDSGVNYVDTAYPYHGTGMDRGGNSELFVAKALKNGYRSKVKIATKLPSWLIKNRQDMDRYLNEQLKRLETESIDFYLVHGLNSALWQPLKEAGIFGFLDQALKDGRIKHAGFSFHDTFDLFKQIVDDYDWSFCLIQYNYVDEDAQAGIRGLKYAFEKDLGIAIMEPLRGGKLAKVPASVQNVFNQGEVKRPPFEWALKWLWNQPEISVVLSGMNEMEQLQENMRIASETEANSLKVKELEMFKQARTTYRKELKIGCTGCGYCMPCPNGVDIPSCFNIFNNYHMFGPAEGGFYRMLKMYGQEASNCLECGICEEHCPQSIAIPEELKNVAALFE